MAGAVGFCLAARELRPGDWVATLSRGPVRLESVEAVQTDDGLPVFNLRTVNGAGFCVGQAGVVVQSSCVADKSERPPARAGESPDASAVSSGRAYGR